MITDRKFDSVGGCGLGPRKVCKRSSTCLLGVIKINL